MHPLLMPAYLFQVNGAFHQEELSLMTQLPNPLKQSSSIWIQL
jgi:hypothetical protein